jgi:hypothetical protein
MPDRRAPHVFVQVGAIVIRSGEVITLSVVGPNTEMIQIEVRSVGVLGATCGHPEIFVDELALQSFQAWKPMETALREQFPHERLPASEGGK